ncbi:MAG TPA: hypothetical protein VFZ75_09850 [Actinomycetota bacterium]|nr:hypothetical protein [Actinomycetota bacterium]
MTITVHDPVRPLDRPAQPALPEGDSVGEPRTLPPLRDELPRRPAMRVPSAAPADDVRTALRAHGGKTTFELASRGGYARTVTGIVAYVDEEAQTYMVLGDDDELLRVPLREITSSRESPMNDGDRPGSRRDAEGLGTAH